MKYWDEIERLALERKIVMSRASILPCAKEEVMELEKAIGLRLPEVYREFLLWAGHGLGMFMTGSRFYYEQLFKAKAVAIEMLQEDSSPDRLPDDAFVFWMHQGYMFSFFRVSEGDNPPVHNYREGENEGRIRWNYEENFVSFVGDEINYQADCYDEARQYEEMARRDWRNA